MNKVRRPTAAGLFYPSDSKKLKEEVDTLLSLSKPKIEPGKITGLISPHAGYIYSGRTAAFAFNLLSGKNYRKIIVISPSHHEYFPGITVYEGDYYETPLGRLPVNSKMRESLIEGSRLIFKGIAGHRQEHAIEVQLPFLQEVLDDFEIVPIVMGDQGRVFIEELSYKLAQVTDEETVIVASSDLSHYHNKADADRLDSVVEKRIRDFDYDRLQFDLEERICEACGGGPIVTLMTTAAKLNSTRSAVLHRSDSGDTSGDNEQVVGYLSAAIYGG